ncbi:hypothetical protein cypCar_00043042 [Cyprinus carpio]|nr:hypothetical protein cypCar_00043042 [Cyprinus carpio]
MAFNSGSDSAVASTPEGGDSLSHNAAINISQSDSRRPSARASVTGEGSGRGEIASRPCSYAHNRKSALLVEVPRGIAAGKDTAVRTIMPTRTASHVTYLYPYARGVAKQVQKTRQISVSGTAVAQHKNQTANRTVLNNEVYGIAMKANISNLTENIEMFITQKDPVSKPSCYSWDGNVCPAPIVTVIVSVGGYEAVILNTTSEKITRMCWITDPYIHYIVNIGYYAVVFVFTTGIFILIVRNIKATEDKRKTFRKQLMMVLSLFLLFGLTWSVAFFSYGPMLIPSYYIFTVLNSFQAIKACQAQGGIMSISVRIGEEESRYRYVLYLNESERICVTCDDGRSTSITSLSHTISYNPTTSFTSHTTFEKPISTVKPPEITYNLTDEQNNEVGYTEPSKASEKLTKIKSLVEGMEKNDTTNAALIMGDVIGVLLRQPMDKPTKDINICYSSRQNMINLVESSQKTELPWCVKIPSEALNKSRLENKGSAYVGVLRFVNMGNKNETEMHTVLNNDSYGITMGAEISHLTNNIDIFIKKDNTVDNHASCVSWDEKGELNWTTFGCETKIEDNIIRNPASTLFFIEIKQT